MKKILAIFIALCMLAPLCACAEEPVFTFRNGYAWGMTRAEVIALNEAESLGENISVNRYPAYENVPIGEFTAASIRFIFEGQEFTSGDVLCEISYNLHEFISGQYEDALSLKNEVKDEIISYYGDYDSSYQGSYLWRREEATIYLDITDFARMGLDTGDVAYELSLSFSQGDGGWNYVSVSPYDVEYDGSLRNGF